MGRAGAPAQPARPGAPPQAACKDTVAAHHASLLDGYTARGVVPLADVPDDGYFVQNVGHHLAGAGRQEQLRGLLLDPGWLARKLAAAGAAGVVADFRRWGSWASGWAAGQGAGQLGKGVCRGARVTEGALQRGASHSSKHLRRQPASPAGLPLQGAPSPICFAIPLHSTAGSRAQY